MTPQSEPQLQPGLNSSFFSFLGEKRVSEISLFDKLMGKNVARLKKRLGRASYTRTPRASVGSHLF